MMASLGRDVMSLREKGPAVDSSWKQTPEQAQRHLDAAESKRVRKRLAWVLRCPAPR